MEGEGRRWTWLAENVGIDKSEMSHIANGKDPGRERARRIAKVLGRSASECGWPHHDGEVEAA